MANDVPTGCGDFGCATSSTPSKSNDARDTTTIGRLSRWLNRLAGGEPGQTLCARVAARDVDCRFCRWVARFTEPNHCALELARWKARKDGR